jgi:hypothetical protein
VKGAAIALGGEQHQDDAGVGPGSHVLDSAVSQKKKRLEKN